MPGATTTTGERAVTASMTDAQLARMAKALGHPARIEILRVLAGRSCVCGDIVDALPLAQSTVSQHLKVLREAGWITGVVDGPRTCYALDREAIGALRSLLDPLLARWEGAADCATASSCTRTSDQGETPC